MKNVFTLFLYLLVTLLVFARPTLSFAQETIIMTISPQPSVTVSTDYTMPFPGMLPDNPLYFLKTGRDQLIGLLITDLSKKASFDLLQSEKFVAAMVMQADDAR